MFECSNYSDSTEYKFDCTNEAAYSDECDSDIENELYSRIYHMPISVDSFQERIEQVEENTSQNLREQSIGHEIEDRQHPPIPSLISSTPVTVPSIREMKVRLSNIKDNRSSDSDIQVCDSSSSDSSSSIGSFDSSSNNVVIHAENDCYTITDSESDSSASSIVVLNSLSKEERNKNLTPIVLDDESSSSDEDILSKSLPAKLCSPTLQKNLWHIDQEDKFCSKKLSKRYYSKQSALNCTNCRKIGHTSKHCTRETLRKCYLCGGIHVAKTCSNKVCGICFKWGHNRTQCYINVNTLICKICNMSGHIKERCPDQWRRYHLTTTFQDGIALPSNNTEKGGLNYCYNCGRNGHYGYECKRQRPVYNSLPASPFISSYTDPAPSRSYNTRIFRNKTRSLDPSKRPNKVKKKKKKVKLSYQEPNFDRTPDSSKFSKTAQKKLKWMQKRFPKLRKGLFVD